MDVTSARFVEVIPARRGDVGDGGGHGGGYPHRSAGRGGGPSPVSGEHARRAGAHEMERAGVGHGAADQDGNLQFIDETLEIERLSGSGDVLGGNRRAADDEKVHSRIDDRLPQILRASGRKRPGDGDPRRADFG